MTDIVPGSTALETIQPVSSPAAAAPRPGIALCLSGGGYRAMIFHLGTLWRLNQLGFLKKLKRVSSVSGGSITAGALALAWKKLRFDGDITGDLEELVVNPIRSLANHTIDRGSVFWGMLLPRQSIADEIAKAYREHLFGRATLQDLPGDDEGPRFVINATNVQTKVLWRFSKPFMGDHRVGLVNNPTLELAIAVAASSAFPPFLSPAELELRAADLNPATTGVVLKDEAYRTKVVLTDGGVYDNLGLETAWKNYETIFVSDGGGECGDEPDPKRDWAQHAYRVLTLLDNQVRSLRKRQVIDSYKQGLRKGAYWGIRTNIADYGLADSMNCPVERTIDLANVATRLKGLDTTLQERIINWGYAVCDAALRKHVDPTLPPPRSFPYPAAGV